MRSSDTGSGWPPAAPALALVVEGTGERRALAAGGELCVGRGEGSDWVLADDPARPTLSRRHCRFAVEPDGASVTDLESRNGTWLNGRRLPARTPAPLREGDVLELGEHRLLVARGDGARGLGPEAPAPGAAADPFGQDARPIQPPLAPRPPLPAQGAPPAGGAPPGASALDALLGPGWAEADPDGAPEPTRGALEAGLSSGWPPWDTPSAPAVSPARPPREHPSAGSPQAEALLPHDAVRGPAAGATAAADVPSADPLGPVVGATATPPPPSEPALSAAPPVGGGLGRDAGPDAARPAPEAAPHDRAAPPAAVVPPPPAVADEGVAPDPAYADRLLAAFLDGAGLPRSAAEDRSAEALLHEAGRTFACLADGLRELLAMRAALKDHARLDRTRIGPALNNPLKLSATAREATAALLVGRGEGYMPPLAAAQASIGDLMAHELALFDGTRAAVDELLEQFAPAALERRLDGAGALATLLRGGRGARLWELYRERHGEIARVARTRFMGHLDDAFREAYARRSAEVSADAAATGAPAR